MSQNKSEQNYIAELIEEIEILDPNKSKYTIKLLGEELNRIRKKVLRKEQKAKEKPEEIVKLTHKIMVPTTKYPGYNFVGKLMGPKATNIKRIQVETQSSVLILGQGSTRDRGKEQLLAQSGEPKFAHFREPLHISIHVKGFKVEAEARLQAAINEVEKYMDPKNEQVKAETHRTLTMLSTNTKGGGFPAGVGGVAPIIRVGVPPANAIVLSGSKGTSSSSYKPRGEGYTYDASFDGTYEGYPTTAPEPSSKGTGTPSSLGDAYVLEPRSPPQTSSRPPLKRSYELSPSSSSSEGSPERERRKPDRKRDPEPDPEPEPEPEVVKPKPAKKRPVMTVKNMFRKFKGDNDEQEDDDDDD